MVNYILHDIDGQQFAEIAKDTVITDAQQFLEISMNLPTERIILHKENLDPSFFDLRTGVAGEILQKVVNYRLRLGIVGNHFAYESKSLNDFIRESNKSNRIVFTETVEAAMKRLAISN